MQLQVKLITILHQQNKYTNTISLDALSTLQKINTHPIWLQPDQYPSVSRQYPSTWVWRVYDERFRRLRAVANLPWHIINQNVLADVLESVKSGPSRVNPITNYNSRSQKQPVKSLVPRACWAFNRERAAPQRKDCSSDSCKFVHKCSVCAAASHGSFNYFSDDLKDILIYMYVLLCYVFPLYFIETNVSHICMIYG